MFYSLHINFRRTLTGLLLAGVALAGCKKVKIDQRTGNLVTTGQISASRTRLVNLDGFSDLRVNGQLLTNGKGHLSPLGDDPIIPAPTVYFPGTGKLGSTYFLPQQFFSSGDTANVDLFNLNFTPGQYAASTKVFTATDNYAQPHDYYLTPYRDGSPGSAQQLSTDSVFVIPRTVSAAADPTHIKIRLINLTSTPDDAHMTGPMSLAFADGSLVSPVTSSIATGQVSDYIELPYGTYQFKVLTADGRQVPGGPQAINRYTGVIDGFALTFAPIQTYLPGGVYTIVLSAMRGFSYPSAPQYTTTMENSFQVVTDISPAANLNYARIQAANAWPGTGSPLTLLVDNQPLSKPLAYDSASDYQVLPSGPHYIALQDARGNLLVQQMFTWNGGDNYTIWIYPDSNARPALLFAQNNLSGNFTIPNGGDGSDNTYQVANTNFPFWIRFLNFCPDLPLVTFTRADGQLFGLSYNSISGACAQNLAPGQPAAQSFQYVASFDSITATILAFRSQPLIVPGDWLTDIAPLHYTAFIQSPPGSYPNGTPQGEPGVYTVALTGRHGTGAVEALPAKMIVLKHTK